MSSEAARKAIAVATKHGETPCRTATLTLGAQLEPALRARGTRPLPQPQLSFPAPKPQTHILLPPLESSVVATPPDEERPALRSESPLLPALDGVIDTRMMTIVDLRRVARWLKFTALGVLLISLPVALGAGLSHFLLIFGFAVFLGALAIFFHARIDLLGQNLVGLRYARSGLADELLPNRQREPLLRKVAEVLD